MQRSPGNTAISASWLIEFIDLCDGAPCAAALLRRLAATGQWPVSLGAFDEAGVAAVRHHLARAGLVPPADPFERPARPAGVAIGSCAAAADAVELVAAAVDVANERQPPEPSRLAITATSDAELLELTARLEIRRLWELVEYTIRSATTKVVLGAPYWNLAALERLRPALEGARTRGVVVDFVVQGGSREPSTRLDALHAFAHELRQYGSETPGYDTVTVWQFDADDMSARHTAFHAKFVVADSTSGYLGSANMTDQGLEINFEIGAMLGPRECEQLLSVLDVLRDAHVLKRA